MADFGLSRAGTGEEAGDYSRHEREESEDYYRAQRGVFPVRWTAPEAMESLKFTHASDMWSFGVVLYHLCYGRPLWLTDINDNAAPEDLRTLASEPDLPLRRALDKALNKGETRSASIDLKAATDLLRRLLEPDDTKRLEYFHKFKSPMLGVLEEPFFQPLGVDAAAVKDINEKVDRIERHALKLIDMSEEHRTELLLTRKVAPSLHITQSLLSLSVNLHIISSSCNTPSLSLHTCALTNPHRCCSRASSRRPR